MQSSERFNSSPHFFLSLLCILRSKQRTAAVCLEIWNRNYLILTHSSTRRYRNQKEVNISDRSADTQLMEVFLIASRNDKEGGGGGVWHSTEEKQRRKTCHVRRSHRPRLPRSCRPGRRHPQRTLEGSKVGACGRSKRVISLFRKQSNWSLNRQEGKFYEGDCYLHFDKNPNEQHVSFKEVYSKITYLCLSFICCQIG